MNIEYYQQKVESLNLKLSKIKQKNRVIIAGKVISFGLFSYFVYVAFTSISLLPSLIGSTIALLGYILFYRIGSITDRQEELLSNIKSCHQQEIRSHQRDFSSFDQGSSYINPAHSYSYDLDLFGPDSFFQRINRTVSFYGQKALAQRLCSLPTKQQEVLERQKAIHELCNDPEWCTYFRAYGKGCENDLSQPIKALYTNQLPPLFDSKLAYIEIIISVSATMASFVLASVGLFSWNIPMLLSLLQLCITLFYTKKIFKSTERLCGLQKVFSRYKELLLHIRRKDFASEELAIMRHTLVQEEVNAISAMQQLSSLISQLDSRNNMLGTVLLNAFCLRDIFLIRKYNNWKKRYLSQLPEWLRLIGEVDALVTLANYQFNTPDNQTPILDERPDSNFQFINLYHPFLTKKSAIGNDLKLSSSQFAIITGANMAGKSTFLRSVGLNYVMALNGMNVCASYFKVPVVALFTSMRTSDNLAKNISYFNSELLRLEQLIEFCQDHPYSLIILDEILKGTNSEDKLKGSKLFLSEISKLPVTGMIATHDIELSKLEQEKEKFTNYCFEIELSEEITYTYRISQGVAQNMNATYLLNSLLQRKLRFNPTVESPINKIQKL